ncbi:MAG: glycosyltransferase [Segetibacter sp.]
MDRTPQVPPAIPPVVNKNHRPLWSVMVPAYNCIQYLKQTLESILIQEPGAGIMQIEVIDDHSTDGDVASLVQEVGKGRIKYFRQSRNVGSLRNFETCINRSTGEWLHLLHGDDMVKAGFYKEIAELFQSYPESGAAFTNYSYIDEDGVKCGRDVEILLTENGVVKDFLSIIARRQKVQPPAIVVKRKVYETLGSFFAVHYGEDWEMWIRIASRFPVAYSPKCLALYRVSHKTSISYRSFLTGQNILDISQVIDIVQPYIPIENRRKLKTSALMNNALYCMRVANGLLLDNREAAFIQAKGAFNMHPSGQIIFYLIRFYLMHLLRYKQLERLVTNSLFPFATFSKTRYSSKSKFHPS